MLWKPMLIIFPSDEVTFLMAQSWGEESLLLIVDTQINMLTGGIQSATLECFAASAMIKSKQTDVEMQSGQQIQNNPEFSAKQVLI